VPRDFQVALDCADPKGLGQFWIEALGYVEEPPPAGFDTWPDALAAWGLTEDQYNDAYAAVDPEGKRPRLFFHKVPEGKTAKNRLHLDVRVSGMPGPKRDGKDEILAAEVARLEARGARLFQIVDEPHDYTVVMQDPEGNEFCLT
jgi:hypothetical protein